MAVLIALTLLVGPTVAQEESPPDHGLNETTACTLWAGDEDGTNKSVLTNRTSPNATGLCALAAETDIPLDTPPVAVERWNRRAIDEFPHTGTDRSVHPPDTDLRGGRFVEDGYLELFAVQPSTRARLSPADQPLYVAPNGTMLATADYRVEVPPDDSSGDDRVYWYLVEHSVTDTQALVDGTVIANGSGGSTPEVSYTLDEQAGHPRSLTIEANITVELKKRVETCISYNIEGDCDNWLIEITYPTETVTVQDSVDVVAYNLSLSGYQARYPNGDLGLVVYKDRPWLGHSLPRGDVRGVWRFYAARDAAWDSLVYETADDESTVASPLRPLQVHAYPIEPGPTASPHGDVTIQETYGSELQSPTLPTEVQLDTVTGTYTASYGIATRTETSEQDLDAVTATGLVRGIEATANPASFVTVPVNRSNLTLSVQNRTADTVTVRVHLRDAASGTPIATADREGAVVVQERRVNTTDNGTVTTTLPRTAGGVSARYEPGRWWRARSGYVGDTDVVAVHGTALDVIATLYRIAIPVSIVLLAAFLLDRITGWNLWPLRRRF